MEKPDDTKKDWSKVRSKRYPNKFYYFNKKTGKSKWVNDEEDKKLDDRSKPGSTTNEKPQTNRQNYKSGRRNGIQKRTPAQDRLKQLTKTLALQRERNVDLDKRLDLHQLGIPSNILTTKNNKTDSKTPKIPKFSVQDRLKIKSINVPDDDVVMKDQREQITNTTSHIEDETEFMDWEPIPENIVLHEILNMRTNKVTLSSPDKSTEKINLRSLVPSQNNFYIVIDTNIFISNLQFLQDLSRNLFPKNTFLVVPYVVLQELDNLKHRRNQRISLIATHAIKFLNRSFITDTSRLCGQTAIKATEYLIEIQNSDDKIINCCLQIAANSDRIILLSNDINLRNKALFNQIDAYSQSDLQNSRQFAAELNQLN